MKKQIRAGIFETNSSSVHTLQISNKHCQKNRMKIEDDDYIHISLNTYYGKNEKDYVSQRDKLIYVCTWLYIYYGCDIKSLYGEWQWIDFNICFCNYVNNNDSVINLGKKCRGIKIDRTIGNDVYNYLDHQSAPYGSYDGSNCIVNLECSSQLVNFIFNPDLWLHTGCD